MNNPRRKALNNIIEKLEYLQADLEALKDEEDEYRDNIPENLQESQRYYDSEEASDNLDGALEAFDELIEYIYNAVN